MSKGKNLNYMVYELHYGEEIVYIGITNDIDITNDINRMKKERKQFDDYVVATSDPMTEEEAMKSKSRMLELYQKNNQGKNPKYNDSNSG